MRSILDTVRGESALSTRYFAVLTCMHSWIRPSRFTGLADGVAHVIRNEGGRATDDAVRSLVIGDKVFGAREWLVIQPVRDGTPRSTARADLVDDLARLRAHPLVARSIAIRGFLYDERSQRLQEVDAVPARSSVP